MFFKPYHQKVFEILWKHPKGLSSRQIWEIINEEVSISRASIINFLQDMAEYEILDYNKVNGKGGKLRIYWHRFSRNSLSDYLMEMVQKSLRTIK
jgi:predicted transcriptional regulator